MPTDPAPPLLPRRGLKARVAGRIERSPRTAGLPPGFWLLWVGTLINRAGTFVIPFVALYVTRGRGHSAATAGAVLLAFGIGGLPAQPLGGALADRIGRAPTAAFSLFASSAALTGLAFARSPWQLVLAAGLLGFVADMFRPAVSALIVDLVPPPDRPRAFGLQFWAVNLGFAGAAAIGGVLAEISWTLLFIGDAITTAVFGLILLRWVRDPERTAGEGDPSLLGSLKVVRRDRLFLGLLVVSFTYALMYSQTQSTLSLEVVSHGLTERDYGLILALNGLVIVLVQPFVIARVSSWAPGLALAGAQLVMGIGLGLTALVGNVPLFGLTVVIWTLGEIVGATFAAPIVADLSPPDMRGRYQGWFGLSFSVAFALGPTLGLAAFGRYGGGVVWAACLGAGVVTALLTLRLRRGIVERRQAAAARDAGAV